MKKIIYISILCIFLVSCINKSGTSGNNTPVKSPVVAETKNKILSISTGTSFGECAGYCFNQIEISSKKIIISKKYLGTDNKSFPDINKEETFSEAEWSNLVNLVDLNKFNSLKEVIGCPDCADGGAEWVEITNENNKKKVTFEFNKSVNEIDNLLKSLRELRNKYLEK